MIRMSEKQAKEAQRRLGGCKGEPGVEKEKKTPADVMDEFAARLNEQFPGKFTREENLFWHEGAKVAIAIDDWGIRDGFSHKPILGGWMMIHFSTDGLKSKARMNEAMQAVAQSIRTQREFG